MPHKATSSVSVIMPTYNGEQFLLETLESLKQQSYPIFELIVSDDSSSDRTVEIANNYANTVNF
jgi:glycosyltransferase involved in cell wall biosynthesis